MKNKRGGRNYEGKEIFKAPIKEIWGPFRSRDWENNEFAKRHIKQRFGDAEVPEEEIEEEETEGATIGDTLDEETRRRIAGGVDNVEE